jgi:RNA polymerase sigma-70 factor (sigma-E family)
VTSAALDFETLYQTQWHALVRLALLLVGDRGGAEDVVQEAFLNLYRRPPASVDSAAAYLRTSVVNGSRSVARKRLVARKHPFAPAPDGPAADQNMLVAAEYEHVIRALRSLPRRQREVLVLRYWSELSLAEVADALGISVGTAKSTASRGLDALERMLGGAR